MPSARSSRPQKSRIWKIRIRFMTSAGARTLAVTMQLEPRLALTPTLSPREREKQSRSLGRSPRGDRLQHGENALPLLGERAGVRASLLFVCIDTPRLTPSKSYPPPSFPPHERSGRARYKEES